MKSRVSACLSGAPPWVWCALSFTVLAAGAAEPAGDGPAAEGKQLEAVTVTAERRSENLKNVPISVSTLRGEKLEVINASGQDVRALSGRAPSLNIESSFGRAFPRFYIRGYGNTDFHLNASQPVSLIYDDVVQENPILKGFPAFDLKSVEVLSGPQGTLFGRNTPAGVVKFESVPPSQRQDGYLTGSYGRWGTRNLESAFNLPLSGDWSARVSALSQHRDNWVRNVGSGPTRELEGYDDRALRVQALYKPDGGFSALFNIHDRDLDGTARLFRGALIAQGTNDLVAGFNPAIVALDGANSQTVHSSGAGLKLKWMLDGVTLHAVTGYETVQAYSRGDVDGTSGPYTGAPNAAFPVETADGIHGHEQMTQEFRAESSGAGPVRWQGGLYLFRERYGIDSDTFDGFGGARTSRIRTDQTNNAWAVFGSAGYDLLPELKVRAGMRYTHDRKFQRTFSDDTAINTSGGVSAETAQGRVNWDISGIYAATPLVNLYGRVATGFRGASIQPPGNAAFGGPQSVAQPETLRSYEVGTKADLFDKRTRVSAALFHYDVKDLQLSAVGGANNQTLLVNAKKAMGRGVEVNLESYIGPSFLVTFGGSYNLTRIKDPGLAVATCTGGCTVTDPAGPVPGTALIDGNPLPQAPRWVANVTARYGVQTAGGNEFYVYTDWAYRSKVNFFLYDAVEFTGKPLLEGGLRLGYVWGDGRYDAAVFVRNITNQVRATGGIDFNNLTGFVNDPRTWGIQARMRF